jgi:hypothetical protein
MLAHRQLEGGRGLIEVSDAGYSALFEGHSEVFNIQPKRWQLGIQEEIHTRLASKLLPDLMGLTFALQF